MSEISEFEARLSAALERIGRAVAAAQEQAAQPSEGGGIASQEMEAEMGNLREALEAEKAANSELEARVKTIHERQEQHVASLEGEVSALREQLAAHDKELLQLRRINERLRDNNGALREANAQGGGNPNLVNSAMMVELEALKVARSAEATELEAILKELKSVAEAAAPATQAAPQSEPAPAEEG